MVDLEGNCRRRDEASKARGIMMTCDSEQSLAILSQTIASHAQQLADEEWRNERGEILADILNNAGLTDTVVTDGREVPLNR